MRKQILTTLSMGALLAVMLSGSAVSVAAQSEVWQPPTGFTATLASCPATTAEGSAIEVGGVDGPDTEYREHVSSVALTATDERVSGNLVYVTNADMYRIGDEQVYVGTSSVRLENDGGAWNGTIHEFLDTASATAATADPETDVMVLQGEGAYEGLTAMLQIVGQRSACDNTARGVIVMGDLPAAPDSGPAIGL